VRGEGQWSLSYCCLVLFTYVAVFTLPAMDFTDEKTGSEIFSNLLRSPCCLVAKTLLFDFGSFWLNPKNRM
jgi:hypothetical protein